jgi:glutamine synthetase
VVATELEFYLIDDSTARAARAALAPVGQAAHRRRDPVLRALDAFDRFFTDLYDACEAMDIPADATISEAGLGQFEINLMHQADLLKAADDAWLFKLLVKGLARKWGFAASFMAKPYEDYAGNGMHVHFSVLDAKGATSSTMAAEGLGRPAAGGGGVPCGDAGLGLLFAPHGNSYDRLVPGAHAPTGDLLGL